MSPCRPLPLLTLGVLATFAVVAIPVAHAQTIRTWGASPGSGAWGTGANWAGGVAPVVTTAALSDRAAFGTSSTTTLNNDISGLTLTTTSTAAADTALLFNAGASSYTISGNNLSLFQNNSGATASVILNNSTAAQTFGVNLSIASTNGQGASIVTSGDLTFNGTINVTSSTGISFAMGSTTSRTVTLNSPITISSSATKGISFGGAFSNPGGTYEVNSTITKNGVNASDVGFGSGTTNLNAATSMGSATTKNITLMASSSTLPTFATLNINHTGALDEMNGIEVFQQGATATNGTTGTATMLIGANGWSSAANIRIGTNANAGAAFVVGGKTGLGANGTATFSGTITAQDSNLDRARTVTMQADEGRVNFTGAISTIAGGATVMGVTKTGNGIVALSGANTYTGNTVVSAGTMLLNNSSGSATGSTGTLSVNAGRLAGFGSTASVATIASGARITAGDIASGSTIPTIDNVTQGNNSLAFSQALSIDGAYDWYLGNTSESVGFSQLDISSGSLTLGGTSSFTLTAANFLGGIDPNSGNPFWNVNRSWTIGDVAGGTGIAGSFGSLSLGTWTGGAFSLTTSGGTGNDLVLNWTAVPEPGSAVLLTLGLSVVIFGFRRRGTVHAG